jgi:serine/threonine protein phosphatase 1
MTTSPGRLIAIGDVHGCIHGLEAVIQALVPTADDRLVFLGDLVDHGRDSCQVLDYILELQSKCQVVLIEGNHEEMMLAARESQEAFLAWQNWGGAPTLSSYHFPGKMSDVKSEHWQLLESCLPFYETEDFIFTHANYLPDLSMSEQPGHYLRWTLFDPHEMHRHESHKPVVVGHTEQKEGEIVDLGFAMCIDTACWRYGWLTAMDCYTGDTWQASRWGVMREPEESSHREKLTQIFSSYTA